MGNLIVMIGISGSGKSSIAEDLRLHNKGYIVSTDAIRGELLGDEGCQEKGNMIFQEAYRRIDNALKTHKNVIFDATNLSIRDRKKLFEQFGENHNLHAIYCNTPVDQCIKNQEKRFRKVSGDVVRRQFNKLVPPDKANENWTSITKIDWKEV